MASKEILEKLDECEEAAEEISSEAAQIANMMDRMEMDDVSTHSNNLWAYVRDFQDKLTELREALFPTTEEQKQAS